MVVSYRISYALEKQSLTGLRRGYDKHTLAFSDRRKHIHQTAAFVLFMTVSEQVELLVREEWSEEVERNPVPDKLRCASIDILYSDKREIFVSIARRSDFSRDGIAAFQCI